MLLHMNQHKHPWFFNKRTNSMKWNKKSIYWWLFKKEGVVIPKEPIVEQVIVEEVLLQDSTKDIPEYTIMCFWHQLF
jgi:hypothetical protein